ncbi:copper resistance protein CopC/CopD [Rhodobacter sp. NTK016B]|uniref:copper resistance CopC/CopD family protein n=1 Tax=Rhodobacter sp. NTK016B TaxID=2759676 RepID=UPI001A8DF817|nr:CopD family protein [Rhodobacter sp. NTK016B]MBN8294831.1 copper resistance protein CopC/CopD [Rhodobacter sp. NTK016B]
MRRAPGPAPFSGVMPVLTLVLALLLAPAQASAHAQLHGTDPAEGAVLQAWPEAVTLSFSEGVAPLVLRWVAPDGSTTEVEGRAENADLVVPPPDQDATGSYLLSWRVTSADGHPVGGVVTLHLGAASEVAAIRTDEGMARVTTATRALVTILLVLITGVALHAALITRQPAQGRLRRTALIAAAVSLPACVLLAGLHGLELRGESAEALTSTTPWLTALTAPLARTIALSLLALAMATLALRRGSPLAALAAWGALSLSFVVSGHAALAPPAPLSTLAMLVHAVALIWWMGLLVPLAADLNHPDASLRVRRFSTLAVPLVAALVLSGGWLVWAQTGGDLAALTSTVWGRLLLVKLALVAGLLILAALNRLRWTPALAAGKARPLARAIRAEIVLGALVLILAAGFRLTPPPRAIVAPPLALHIHTEAAMADVTVTPGQAGPVTLAMAFQTGDFEALEPQEVEVALAPSDGTLEPIRMAAVLGPSGLWVTPVVTLPFGGAWSLTLRVLITDFRSATLTETLHLN